MNRQVSSGSIILTEEELCRFSQEEEETSVRILCCYEGLSRLRFPTLQEINLMSLDTWEFEKLAYGVKKTGLGGLTLHLVDLRIPTHAVRNQSARLECHFDLDGETLYSVKWYKDGNEFYRYVPRDLPPTQTFPLPGVTVDMHNSTETVVVLNSVQLSSTGIYRCEVSGEAPFFETVTEHQRMTVVALPEEGPKISGGRPRYQVGDTVRVNCTSGKSKPAAQLNWMINGEPADPRLLRGPETVVLGREGLESSVLGLEFVVRHKHFKRGNMKLKCLATIATLYLVSNEESVEGERPLKASVLESRGTAAPSGSRADRVQAASSRTTTYNAHAPFLLLCCLIHLSVFSR